MRDLRGLLDFCIILYQSLRGDDSDVVFIVGNGVVWQGKVLLEDFEVADSVPETR